MSEPTRPSLLVRLRDGTDQAGWARFADLYTPLVHRHLRRRGLRDAGLANVTQEVFRTVAGAIRRFQQRDHPGAFRGWLKVVRRSRPSDFLAAQKRQVAGTGDTAMFQRLEEQAGSAGENGDWESEYQRSVE